MSKRLILTLCASAAILSACATNQENPYYKYSTQYKSSSPHAATTNAPVAYEAETSNANITFTNASEANQAYTLPASTGQTRIVNQCVMSAGVETCQPVEIPVASIQASPAQTAQNSYLVNASSVQTDGRLTQVESECLQDGTPVPCNPVEIPITTDATVSQPYTLQPEIIMATSGNNTAATQAPTDSYYGGTLNGTPGYYAVHGTPDAKVETPASSNALPDSYAFTRLEDSAPSTNVIAAGSAATGNGFANSYVGGNGGMLHNIVEGDTVYSLARSTCTSVAEIRSLNNLNAESYIRLGDNIRLPSSRC